MPILSIMLVVVYRTNWLELCFLSMLLILLLLATALLPFVSWHPPSSGRGAWILTIFNLDTRKENCWAFKALVSKSAIWEFVLRCNILIYLPRLYLWQGGNQFLYVLFFHGIQGLQQCEGLPDCHRTKGLLEDDLFENHEEHIKAKWSHRLLLPLVYTQTLLKTVKLFVASLTSMKSKTH